MDFEVLLILKSNFLRGSRGRSLCGQDVRWKKLSITGPFRLQIASDKDFRSMILSRPGKSNISLVILTKSGKFYWRVSFNSDDNIIKVISCVRILEINDVLADPASLFPGKGSKVDMSDRDILTFSWKLAPGANVYEF